MQEKIVDEIGKVQFLKNRRSKRILITVKPFGGVRVSLPYWSSYAYAMKVVEDKKEWIKKAINKVNQLEDKRTLFDLNSTFHTKSHSLVIRQNNTLNVISRTYDKEILITIPSSKNIYDEDIQLYIRNWIEKVYRIEAKEYLTRRTLELAKQYGYKYNKISIRRSTSRWGSCTHKNNLNFSLFLMQLPNHLIDFIILHELIHTRIKNHKKDFWKTLDSYTGNAKSMVKELNSYKIGIF
jgi:predicted metal-dependent hydrolase